MNLKENIRMDLSELLEMKYNRFEHILYEFVMYLQTYSYVYDNADFTQYPDVIRNALIESYGTHLRTMIEFFNCEEDCISVKNVFKGTHDMRIVDPENKVKKTINKTISHLTKERFSKEEVDETLTVKYSKAAYNMYPVVFQRIKSCVELLLTETDISDDYLPDLRNEKIQVRLHELARELSIVQATS